MEQTKKIKVAMICHFSNSGVREHLPLGNRKLYTFIRKVLRMPGKRQGYGDLAPWDTYIIESVKQRDDIDLHVISAHAGLKKNKVSFEDGGVHYTFLKCEYATFLKKVISYDDLWRRLNPMTPYVKKAIDSIQPDLVLLVGAENAYYSSTILGLKDYPIYVLCQTVYNNPEFASHDSKNATTEMKILETQKYLGVYSDKHYNLLRKLNYRGFIFDFQWPCVMDFKPQPVSEKRYDFINFAMHLSITKGFHDSIKALAIVKESYPEVKLNLVDGGPDDVREELMQLIHQCDLENNVSFTPFFAEQNDLFQHLQQVRFAVLPCKVDHISGTQVQAMRFGLPVVCYKTTGTPELNKEKECVLIAEMDNVEELACKMLVLMSDSQKAEELRCNAKEYIEDMDKKSMRNMDRLVENFKAIIENYHTGAVIPKEQLFECQFETSKA